jgi:hypothetical protein
MNNNQMRHFTKRIRIAFILCCFYLSIGSGIKSMAAENTEQLGWGEWEDNVLTIDLYALPLSPQHRQILTEKINQLKKDLGVGILGEIEQAISELDNSSLLNDTTDRQLLNTGKLAKKSTNKFHDDVLLEEEILALEFANAPVFEDSEGLKVSAESSELLFKKLINKLVELESDKLTEKKK